jgi:hypothetical protein
MDNMRKWECCTCDIKNPCFFYIEETSTSKPKDCPVGSANNPYWETKE